MHRDTAKGCEALDCVRFIPLPPRKSLNSFFFLFSSFILRNFTGTAILPIFVFHFSSDATYRSIPTNHQGSYGSLIITHSAAASEWLEPVIFVPFWFLRFILVARSGSMVRWEWLHFSFSVQLIFCSKGRCFGSSVVFTLFSSCYFVLRWKREGSFVERTCLRFHLEQQRVCFISEVPYKVLFEKWFFLLKFVLKATDLHCLDLWNER